MSVDAVHSLGVAIQPPARKEPTMETRDDRRTYSRIDIAQEGYESWVELNILHQFYGERETLRSVEWTTYVRDPGVAGGRALRGPMGRTYWFPPTSASPFPQKVYSRIHSGSNSYSEEALVEDVTVDDLLNFASAHWDALYYPYEIDSTGTNPFRPYELRENAR